MPVTEITLITTGFIVYGLALAAWVSHCYARMEVAHPWLAPMPRWQRVAYDPTLVLFGSLPIPALLALMAAKAVLVHAAF